MAYPEEIADLRGRTVLITGANSGIGFEAARQLAAHGPHLLLACRNLEKGERALGTILEGTPHANAELLELDLASLASVRAAAEHLTRRIEALDVLINNAGVMALPPRKTADGFEMQFGTNHLGHFALTGLLFPLLTKATAARVVTVASQMHKYGKMNFEDLQHEHDYERWRVYGQSKLANLLFSYELQRRANKSSLDLTSVACHPGYASTQLQTVGAEMSGNTLMQAAMSAGNAMFSQSAEKGAWPTIYAATSPNVAGGDYIGPSVLNLWGSPKKGRSSRRSHNPEDAAKLWAVSEELTGVRFLSDA
jgi:NAD(P)-dependent dehydrogenase (short-subunit alcohol dehydrogenase family)